MSDNNTKEPQWVKVNDRMPPDDKDYLVKCGGEITYAYYVDNHWVPAGNLEVTYDESNVILGGEVTEWLEGLVLTGFEPTYHSGMLDGMEFVDIT